MRSCLMLCPRSTIDDVIAVVKSVAVVIVVAGIACAGFMLQIPLSRFAAALTLAAWICQWSRDLPLRCSHVMLKMMIAELNWMRLLKPSLLPP